MQSQSWKQLQEQVATTFNQNEIDYDLNYLGRFHRKISKQMTTAMKAQWKAYSKALLKEGVEPVLVDAILAGTFVPKARAATA